MRKGRTDIAAHLQAELACPPFPLALAYIWEAWGRIRRRKSHGFNGPNPIEWPDIDAFCRRTGARLDPRDISLIEAIDDLWLQKQIEGATAQDKQQAIRDGLKAASPTSETDRSERRVRASG